MKFIDCTGVHPLIVSLGASILIAISMLGIWYKRVFNNYLYTVKRIKGKVVEEQSD